MKTQPRHRADTGPTKRDKPDDPTPPEEVDPDNGTDGEDKPVSNPSG